MFRLSGRSQAARQHGLYRRKNHGIHRQRFFAGVPQQIHIVNGVDAKIGIVAEHGHVVEPLKVRPTRFAVRPARLAAPDVACPES